MMILKRLLIAFIVGIACSMAVPSLAQNQTITGVATDTASHSLSGVNVLMKGTSIGTQTANDETFSIAVTLAGAV